MNRNRYLRWVSGRGRLVIEPDYDKREEHSETTTPFTTRRVVVLSRLMNPILTVADASTLCQRILPSIVTKTLEFNHATRETETGSKNEHQTRALFREYRRKLSFGKNSCSEYWLRDKTKVSPSKPDSIKPEQSRWRCNIVGAPMINSKQTNNPFARDSILPTVFWTNLDNLKTTIIFSTLNVPSNSATILQILSSNVTHFFWHY